MSENNLTMSVVSSNLLNIVVFQSAWFLCLYFSASNLIVISVTLVSLVIHCFLLMNSKREWLLILSVAIIGACVDALLGYLGVLIFPAGVLLPLWLFCLWVLFATLLNHSLAWLQPKLLLASVCAAIMAPVSYWAGAKFTDTGFGLGEVLSLIVVGSSWSLVFPVSLWLARHFSVSSSDL